MTIKDVFPPIGWFSFLVNLSAEALSTAKLSLQSLSSLSNAGAKKTVLFGIVFIQTDNYSKGMNKSSKKDATFVNGFAFGIGLLTVGFRHGSDLGTVRLIPVWLGSCCCLCFRYGLVQIAGYLLFGTSCFKVAPSNVSPDWKY